MEDFNKEYSETFFYMEDDMAICSKCKGKKFFVREGKRGYWRYKNTKKGCEHDWRNASHRDAEKFK